MYGPMPLVSLPVFPIPLSLPVVGSTIYCGVQNNKKWIFFLQMMIDRLIMPPHCAFQLRNVEDYFIINVAKKKWNVFHSGVWGFQWKWKRLKRKAFQLNRKAFQLNKKAFWLNRKRFQLNRKINLLPVQLKFFLIQLKCLPLQTPSIFTEILTHLSEKPSFFCHIDYSEIISTFLNWKA